IGGEQVREQEQRDVVQHDRHDHFVRTARGLDEARDTAPDRATDEPGEHRHHDVHDRRQVDRETDVACQDRAEDQLALRTDVEQAGAERQRHREPGGDQRGRVGQRVGERAQRPADGVFVEIDDRAGEHRRVGLARRGPHGRERVARPGEEVARSGVHVRVGHHDQDRADQQREHHRQNRQRGTAGGQLPQEALADGWLVLCRLARIRFLVGRGDRTGVVAVLARLGVGTLVLVCHFWSSSCLVSSASACSMSVGCSSACLSASCGGTPAIIRPSTSRSVSPGTMPTTLPRYITSTRSASAFTSSSSVDTISTAVPLSRSAMIRLCTNSIDPTSSPRVGCAAISRRSGRDSSRAMTTFCWLPPESVLAGVAALPVRMSNSAIRSVALDCTAAGLKIGPEANGGWSCRSSTRLSATEKSPTRPSTLRSSGTKPTPERSTWRTERPMSSLPSSRTDPVAFDCNPRMASVTSVCPLPCTPAMAKTSPARTSNETSSTTTWSRSSTTVSPCTSSTTSPVFGGSLSTASVTERPTIIDASSASEADGSASPTILPSRSTVIRSATARTSRCLCVMNTIDVPLALSCRMISISSSVSWGVSTAVGSSRMRTRASRTNALMI